jgi:hypothetical protein
MRASLRVGAPPLARELARELSAARHRERTRARGPCAAAYEACASTPSEGTPSSRAPLAAVPTRSRLTYSFAASRRSRKPCDSGAVRPSLRHVLDVRRFPCCCGAPQRTLGAALRGADSRSEGFRPASTAAFSSSTRPWPSKISDASGTAPLVCPVGFSRLFGVVTYPDTRLEIQVSPKGSGLEDDVVSAESGAQLLQRPFQR